MGVNNVSFGGKCIFDIRDSTSSPENTFEGVIGYGADGERFVGKATADNFYTMGRKLKLSFPASGWTQNGDVYSQTVATDITANDKGLAQITLSDEEQTRLSELEADENLERVALQNGSVLVEIAEMPEVDLTLEISIINGLATSSKAALMCMDSKQLAFALSADAWTQSGDTYTQTVAVDGLTDDIVFGDVLLNDEGSIAEKELFEAGNVAKFEASDGSITATCYGYPPDIDLQYFIKVFNEE